MGKSSIPTDSIWEEGNLRDEGWEKHVTELKGSIQEKGLLQPIGVVQKAKDGKTFKIIFGHRRLAAIRALGLATISAQVYPKMSAQEELALQLTENAERLNLDPLEEAKAFSNAIEQKIFTVNELARSIHRTASYVSQRVGLLKLSEDVRDSLEAGRISLTHARELCRVTDEKAQKKLLAKAETMDLDTFRDLISKTEDGGIKKSKKGRPKKDKADQVESIMKPRDWDDVNRTLSELNKRQLAAKQEQQRLRSEYLKGLMRGITWALQLGGADQLLETEDASQVPEKVVRLAPKEAGEGAEPAEKDLSIKLGEAFPSNDCPDPPTTH